jgi:hypothetical protein
LRIEKPPFWFTVLETFSGKRLKECTELGSQNIRIYFRSYYSHDTCKIALPPRAGTKSTCFVEKDFHTPKVAQNVSFEKQKVI